MSRYLLTEEQALAQYPTAEKMAGSGEWRTIREDSEPPELGSYWPPLLRGREGE